MKYEKSWIGNISQVIQIQIQIEHVSTSKDSAKIWTWITWELLNILTYFFLQKYLMLEVLYYKVIKNWPEFSFK